LEPVGLNVLPYFVGVWVSAAAMGATEVGELVGATDSVGVLVGATDFVVGDTVFTVGVPVGEYVSPYPDGDWETGARLSVGTPVTGTILGALETGMAVGALDGDAVIGVNVAP